MKAAAYFEKHLFQPFQIKELPALDTSLIVVIPCFKEPNLLTTLQSLAQCDLPKGKTEVIVVINAPENAATAALETNNQSKEEFKSFVQQKEPSNISFHLLLAEELPKKHASVGLARKIGMDEAAWRYTQIEKNGPIVCLDADCTVEPNYLTALASYFDRHPDMLAASIYFEHDLDGPDENINTGILNYELHLRYYVNALKYADYPFYHHTVGSSMAVRSDVYRQQGGMNKRKAGEDFYFLHKLMPLGNFGAITNTVVHPAARLSDRVPFGTGKAMNDWISIEHEAFKSYNPNIFDDLSSFIKAVPEFYKVDSVDISEMPETVRQYLELTNFAGAVREANKHTASQNTFTKRIFRWLNGLRVLQLVHHAQKTHEDLPINEAANRLLSKIKPDATGKTTGELLEAYRILDRVEA